MSINKIYQFFVAAILLCGANVMLTSCEETHDYINIRYIGMTVKGKYVWGKYDGPGRFYAAIVERHY